MIIRTQAVFADGGSAGAAAEITIDHILRNQVRKGPHRPFLIEPPNKSDITGTEPVRLTYRQAEQRAEAIATVLRDIGLRQDDIVAVRMPNTAELVLTLLGIWRAGLVACLLPIPWRRREWSEALDAVAPKALVTTSRIGEEDAALTASLMAEKQFSVRFVAAFGPHRQDGVIALDRLVEDAIGEENDEALASSRPHAGQHVAAITFTETAEGLMPVPRCHASWIAAAMRPAADLRLGPGERMLSPFMLSQTTGLVGALLPCLMTGATLILHHPFDLYALEAQLETHKPTVAAIPAALADELVGLPGAQTLRTILRVTPFAIGARPMSGGPDRLAVSDYASFSEQALLPLTNRPGGQLALRIGNYRVRDDSDTSPVIASVIEADAASNRSMFKPHDLIRFAARMTQKDPRVAIDIAGAMAPDGPWTDVVRQSGTRGRRDRPGSIHTLPVMFERVGAGFFRATGFAPGVGAVGGLCVSLAALDRAYANIDGADAAAVAAGGDTLFVGIVPNGAVPPDSTELRESVDALAIAEHKIAASIATLASLPRLADGEIDRKQIESRATRMAS